MLPAITVVEQAHAKGWHKLWLESDYQFVVDAFC